MWKDTAPKSHTGTIFLPKECLSYKQRSLRLEQKWLWCKGKSMNTRVIWHCEDMNEPAMAAGAHLDSVSMGCSPSGAAMPSWHLKTSSQSLLALLWWRGWCAGGEVTAQSSCRQQQWGWQGSALRQALTFAECGLTWKRTFQRAVKCCVCQGWREGRLLLCEKDTFCVEFSRGAQNKHPSAGSGALWTEESGTTGKYSRILMHFSSDWGHLRVLLQVDGSFQDLSLGERIPVYSLFLAQNPELFAFLFPWQCSRIALWRVHWDFPKHQELRPTGTVQGCPGLSASPLPGTTGCIPCTTLPKGIRVQSEIFPSPAACLQYVLFSPRRCG